jgi:hypothetical protein
MGDLVVLFWGCSRKMKPRINIEFMRGSKGIQLAGLAGFGPTRDGVKVRCLTAWLQPNMEIRGQKRPRINQWGGRWDSNPRSPEPQSGALAN